jgi:stage IV sporulation protein FB
MRFRLFGFPIEFNITMLLLFYFVGQSFEPAAAAVAGLAVVLSILVHELGHAFVARALGGEVQGITLHGLGGVTRWVGGRNTGWPRIAVAAAGSLTSITIGVLLWLAASVGAFGDLAELVLDTPWRVYLGDALNAGNSVVFFLGVFVWANTVIGAFNLLPIGGLDGGTIMSELIEKALPGSGRLHGAIIGLLVGAAVAYLLYQRGFTFAPIIIGIFTIQALMRAVAARPVK